MSENILNISNEIANNILNAFQSFVENIQDFTSNIMTAEMTFNFPNNTDTSNFNSLHNPFYPSNINRQQSQNIIPAQTFEGELVESDRLESIVENIFV